MTVDEASQFIHHLVHFIKVTWHWPLLHDTRLEYIETNLLHEALFHFSLSSIDEYNMPALLTLFEPHVFTYTYTESIKDTHVTYSFFFLLAKLHAINRN